MKKRMPLVSDFLDDYLEDLPLDDLQALSEQLDIRWPGGNVSIVTDKELICQRIMEESHGDVVEALGGMGHSMEDVYLG